MTERAAVKALSLKKLAQTAQRPVPHLLHVLAGALQFLGNSSYRFVPEEQGANHVLFAGKQLLHGFCCGVLQLLGQQRCFRFFLALCRKNLDCIDFAILFAVALQRGRPLFPATSYFRFFCRVQERVTDHAF